jgi:hypothetical protein
VHRGAVGRIDLIGLGERDAENRVTADLRGGRPTIAPPFPVSRPSLPSIGVPDDKPDYPLL